MQFRFEKKNAARIILSFICGLMAASLAYAVQAAVHELGHMAGCYAGSLIDRDFAKCSISSWQRIYYLPPFLYMTIPEQTMSRSYPLFALGGPLASILFFYWLAVRRESEKNVMPRRAIFAAVLILEMFNNVLCGTDNLEGAPMAFCSEWIAQSAFTASMLVMTAAMAMMVYTVPDEWKKWVERQKKRN